MIAVAIELLGAIFALGGALAHARRTRGLTRALAAIPIALYLLGQLLPNAVATDDDFATMYRIGLTLMATAGALGTYFLLRRPAPS